MVKEIIRYPMSLSVEYATDVRVFDETLFSLIDDLKDTINENNLDALSAYQIGSYYNVIIVKDNSGEFIEMINPRLIGHSGSIVTDEQTAYYPDKSAKIQRYDKISVVYQDRYAHDKSFQTSGKLSVIIQRKIDYTFGATFIHKMAKDEKKRFENILESGINTANADYCPTTFHRDKILKLVNIILFFMLLPIAASFFINKIQILQTFWLYQSYTAYGVISLLVLYFFYAQYEGKLHISCDSCQLGNIIATSLIALAKLGIIMTISYFVFKVG